MATEKDHEYPCEHPMDQRWQHSHDVMWQCCLCNSYFWGKIEHTPDSDIYGETIPPLIIDQPGQRPRIKLKFEQKYQKRKFLGEGS